LADPSVAFDALGNLFVCYLQYVGGTNGVATVLQSTDEGNSFSVSTSFNGSFDQPHLTTGPGPTSGQGSVWVTYYQFGTENSVVSGAVVTTLGAVGPWQTPLVITNTDPGGAANGFGEGDIAVGPTGQVAVVFQQAAGPRSTDPTQIRISVNPNGLNQFSGFSS